MWFYKTQAFSHHPVVQFQKSPLCDLHLTKEEHRQHIEWNWHLNINIVYYKYHWNKKFCLWTDNCYKVTLQFKSCPKMPTEKNTWFVLSLGKLIFSLPGVSQSTSLNFSFTCLTVVLSNSSDELATSNTVSLLSLNLMKSWNTILNLF